MARSAKNSLLRLFTDIFATITTFDRDTSFISIFNGTDDVEQISVTNFLASKLDSDLSALDAAEAIQSTDALAATQTDITVTAPFCAGQYSYRGLVGESLRYFNLLGESSNANFSSIADFDNGGTYYFILDSGGSTQYQSTQTIENYADIFAVDDWLDGAADPADPQPVLTPTPTTRSVTQGLLQEAIPIRLASYLAADAVYNGTAGLSITFLSVSVEAGDIYDIELRVYSTQAFSPLNMDFGGTATITNFVGDWFCAAAGSPGAQDQSARVAAPGTDFTSDGMVDAAFSSYFTFKGTMEVAAAGTFALRAAQQTADVSDTTILRGSTLILRRIS